MSPVGSRVEGVLVEVFREQRPGLWAFLCRGAAGAAEDLLQETFLRAWDHRGRLSGESRGEEREGARRFLWRIARNLMIDEIRMRQRRRHSAEPLESESIPTADHGGRILMDDAVRALRETVSTLPDARTRFCLELWLAGRSTAEIATELSLGIDQVRGLLQRGKSEVVRRASSRFRPQSSKALPDEEGSP